jgi:hypothetical protein
MMFDPHELAIGRFRDKELMKWWERILSDVHNPFNPIWKSASVMLSVFHWWFFDCMTLKSSRNSWDRMSCCHEPMPIFFEITLYEFLVRSVYNVIVDDQSTRPSISRPDNRKASETVHDRESQTIRPREQLDWLKWSNNKDRILHSVNERFDVSGPSALEIPLSIQRSFHESIKLPLNRRYAFFLTINFLITLPSLFLLIFQQLL